MYLNGKREYELSSYSTRHDWSIILTYSSCALCSAKKKKKEEEEGWIRQRVSIADERSALVCVLQAGIFN